MVFSSRLRGFLGGSDPICQASRKLGSRADIENVPIERLRAYLPRYATVATLAGMDTEFAAATSLDVVEQYPGTGSTDFWGISFAFSSIDRQAMSSEALERELTLMRACWAFFDDVRSRVSAEMRKGPRGGGRVTTSDPGPPGAGPLPRERPPRQRRVRAVSPSPPGRGCPKGW